jgi:hypothetical protein
MRFMDEVVELWKGFGEDWFWRLEIFYDRRVLEWFWEFRV